MSSSSSAPGPAARTTASRERSSTCCSRSTWSNSMTVLNRPGAAQTIAISYLAQKKGDGNQIGLASGSFINAIARNGSSCTKVHAVDQAVRRLSGVFHRGRFADQEHGRGARPAQSRSERHHLRIPGRPWQSAARIRRQRRQGRGAPANKLSPWCSTRGPTSPRRPPAITSTSASPASAVPIR